MHTQRPTLILLVTLGALISAGCHARVEDAKETRDAGSVTDVDTGSLGRSTSGSDQPLGLRVMPIKDWQDPDIPVILPARAISIWVFPSESKDGLSIREGFWIHRVYENFSWGLTRTMREQSVPLNQATNLSGSPLSMPIPEDTTIIDPQVGFESALKNFNRHVQAQAPWLLQTPSPATSPSGTPASVPAPAQRGRQTTVQVSP